MRKLTLLLILTTTIFDSYAQRKLTLEDCLSLAEKNNLEVKKSELGIVDADYGKKNAFTHYFPSIQATGLGLAANSGLLETGLAGMDLSLIKRGVYGGLSLTQPVYTGGQIANSNKLANEILGLRKEQHEAVLDDVALLTEEYYWQYFRLNEKLKTLEVIEELTNQTLKEVRLAIQAGLATHNKELQVKLRLDEVLANKLNMANNIEITKLLLAQHIGLPSDSIILADIEYKDAVSPLNFFVNFECAVSENKQYRIISKSENITKIQTKIEKGKLLPSLAVGANYLFENLVDKNHTVGMVYATVSIPISGWWGGSYSVRQKKVNEKIAEYSRIDASEKIIVQMKSSYKELEVAYKQIGIAEQSVKSATENVRLNTNYFKSGMVTLNDLLDAQSLFQASKDLYIDKYTDYLIRLSKYNKTIGK